MQAVKVVDPQMGRVFDADLIHTEEGYRLQAAPERPTTSKTTYISPGWIDLHTHVYDGMTSLSISADRVGLQTGVHMVVDAGSAGEATLRGFRQYVAPTFETRVRAWLNISSIGLVHMREVADLRLIDVDKCIQSALENMPFVCGIKVRSSGAIVGELGLQPLQLALLAAREAGLPLMVHIGEAPPAIDDVLNLLDNGDVITHCFHGKTGNPWISTGKPSLALERALERGVKLDVGHGAASFSWDIARRAIVTGYNPYTISTDAHIRNVGGPVYDLPTTMTKLLHCGMPLLSVIQAVTSNPANILREDSLCKLDGVLSNATLFEVAPTTDDSGRSYRDARGIEQTPEHTIRPVGVIVGGIMKALDS